jgi:hypothetical protein
MEHEIWTGNRYLFTCGWNEDPWEAAAWVRDARVIRVQKGQRTEL